MEPLCAPFVLIQLGEQDECLCSKLSQLVCKWKASGIRRTSSIISEFFSFPVIDVVLHDGFTPCSHSTVDADCYKFVMHHEVYLRSIFFAS